MRKYKRNTILLIEWVDIVQDPTWMDEDKAGARPDCDCKTIGFYLKHDKEFVYIASTISGNQRDSITIPLGCISQTTKIL